MTSEPKIHIITSALLQECATIKCDHHGIWEGSSGSLCIAPGTGKSGVRQEDPPFQKKKYYTPHSRTEEVLMHSNAILKYSTYPKTVLQKTNISTILGMWKWNKMQDSAK